MKQKLNTILLMAFVAMMLVACGSSSDDTSTEHQKMMVGHRVLAEAPSSASSTTPVADVIDVLAEVDTSKILTWRDYDAISQKLWREYDKFQMGRFKEYEHRHMQAFAVYQAAKDSAVREIRAKDPQTYHEWLDARELNKYDRYREIETDHPSFEPYRRVSAMYRSYDVSKSALYKAYDTAKDSAYKAYNRKKDFAYQAYVAHGNKM